MAALTSGCGYEHLATKADLERVRGEFSAEMERLRAHIARRIFLFGIAVISAIGAATGITSAVIILA